MKSSSDDRTRARRTDLLVRAAELRDRLRRVHIDQRRQREPLPRDSADAAIAVENDEVLDAIERTATRELELIEAALERVEQGVFGLCGKCAAEIEAERLRAVPYASECRACAKDA